MGPIAPDLWAALLDDAKSRARVHEKVYRRGPGQCHYWLGALSSSGHGRVRLAVRTAGASRPASILVARCLNQSPVLMVGATSVPLVSQGGENKE